MVTVEVKKGTRLHGKWEMALEKSLPTQCPQSDKNLVDVIRIMDKCEADHKEKNIYFRCEAHCPVYQSCIEIYDFTSNQCRDRPLTDIAAKYCKHALKEMMKFSWKGQYR